MGKITIWIIEKDIDYKNTLTEYMRANCRNYIINSAPIENMHIQDFDKIIEESDLIIIDEILFGKVDDIKRGRLRNKVILLTKDRHGNSLMDAGDYPYFQKYSNVDNLIKYMDGKFNLEDMHNPSSNKEEMETIVCLGLSGGAGCSTIASAIATQLSKFRDQRVFYLSLDFFESGIWKFSEGDGRSHEKILYSMFQNDFKNKDGIIENNMIESVDGVWRLPVSSHRNVVSELDFCEKKKYIQELLNDKKFDYFIVDGGNIIDKFAEYLISNADEVVLVDKHGSVKKQYMNNLISYINDNFLDRKNAILVENFVSGNTQTYENAIKLRHSFDIDMGENLDFNTDLQKIMEYVG